MKIDFGKITVKVNIISLIKLYKWVKRYILQRRVKVKVIKKGCPKCGNDVEISGPFHICLNFGKGCDYIKIKGIKINTKGGYYVLQEKSQSTT